MQLIALAGIWLYKRYLTRYTQRCPQLECCSSYGARVIREHGYRIGMAKTIDRVTHCGR